MDFDLTYFAGQSIAAVIPAITAGRRDERRKFRRNALHHSLSLRKSPDVSVVQPNDEAWRVGGWHSTGTWSVSSRQPPLALGS